MNTSRKRTLADGVSANVLRLIMALLYAALVSLAAGCAGSSGEPADDVTEDLSSGEDVSAMDLQEDASPEFDTEPAETLSDTEECLDAHADGSDAETSDQTSPPDPGFVFEQRIHSNAVTDQATEQDRSRRVLAIDGVSAPDIRFVTVIGDATWIADSQGQLFRESPPESGFVKVGDAPQGDVRCLSDDPVLGAVFCSGTGVYPLEAAGVWAPLFEVPAPALQALSCGQRTVLRYAGQACVKAEGDCIPVDSETTGVVLGAACLDGRIVLASANGLWKEGDSGGYASLWTPPGVEPVVDVAASGQRLVAASPSTVVIVGDDGVVQGEYSALQGSLPANFNTSVAMDSAGERWAVGHAVGLSSGRVLQEGVEHFHSLRYLPGERVNDVVLTEQGTLVAACTGGVAFLTREPMTLEAKAEEMFATLNLYFWRLGGFVSPHATLDDVWNPTSASLWDDDNDGQWTQEAVAAFCFAYAATGREDYLEAARKAVGNMFLLQDIPAVDFNQTDLGPGFISRSVVRDDEGAMFADKATQSNWHLVSWIDGHDYYWKDDTSSDETTGHFFGWPIYYDLCAQDDEEKTEVGNHIVALAATILDQGYQLVDLDGLPTEHGYWQPDRLAVAVDGLQPCLDAGHNIVDCSDALFGSAYLNSVEILGAMLSAWHVSGEQRFLDAYESLISVYRYDELAAFSEFVFTWTQRGTINYCDHELADLAFITLLRYDPNADRRQLWIQSMVDAFEYEAGERSPLKSLALACAVDEVPGLDGGVRTLREYPLDMRQFEVNNVHRTDAELDVNDRHGDPQFTTVLPYDEIAMRRWDGNPYGVSDGGSGAQIMSPTFWLLPYWGLRYYGAIVEE